MVTRTCNLSCTGCSTYSDLPHKSYTSWQNGRQQIEPWLERIEFDHFGLMGGEPLINPEISQWLVGIRELMPHTTVRFPTNGLLLKKHPDIIDLLHDIGNVILKITVHLQDQELDDIIDSILSKFVWQPVYEYGIHRWLTTNDLRFQVNRPDKFFMTHMNPYPDAAPYSSAPVKAFEICHQKLCPLLHNGRIFKCSTSGLMQETLEPFGTPNLQQWLPYWNHDLNGSISVQSPDNAIEKFINNISKPHWICQQCPTQDTVVTIAHLASVTRR